MSSKYHAKPEIVDGIRFASKKEALHYRVLKYRKLNGEIERLELQPKFRLEVNGMLVCCYVADFRYWDVKLGATLVVDVKGIRTPVYIIKRKLMLAVHGITITEV